MMHAHLESGGTDEVVTNLFCTTMSHGGGMAMYMDGFRFSLLTGTPPCLNLFFSDWTLHSRGKFFRAMVLVVILGIAVEAVAAYRAKYIAMVQSDSGSGSSNKRRVKVVMTLLHGLQAFMGYILMLATMTYSLEFLICTCTGLCIGYFLFFKDRVSFPSATNPCCDFLENEGANGYAYSPLVEHQQQQQQQQQEVMMD